MGRPDLSAQRRAEILDAFSRCVARFGLEGSSLERIAEEAGMKRSILRHYVGNRNDLVLALTERVLSNYRRDYAQFTESLSNDRIVDQLVGYFFPNKPRETNESILVVESLIAAAEQFPQVQKQLSEYVEDVVSLTASQLEQAYPSASKQACWQVSYGIVSVWFNQESLVSLRLPTKFVKAARVSVRALIASLDV